MSVAVRLLGALTIESETGALELGPARQQAVLATLLLAEGRPVGGEDLAGRIWGAEPPAAANQALRSYVCRLRRSVASTAALDVERASGGYFVRCHPDVVDLYRARRLISRGRNLGDTGDGMEALGTLDEALALWHGEPFAGLSSPWLDDQRRAIEHERRGLELERNDLALRLGAAEHILPSLVAGTAAERYDERLAGQLVLALHASGRTADALTSYDRIRRRLLDDLGTEPGVTLREIQQLVLRPRPAKPSRGTVPQPAARRSAPTAQSADLTRPVPQQLPPSPVGFVDRVCERRVLDDALLGGRPESCQVVALTGIGGVGKTSLAVRWAREHTGHFPDGQLFVDLRGFDPTRSAMRPETALHCLVIALGADPAAIPSDPDALLGLYRSLLAGRRILIVADNAAGSAQVRPLLPPTGPAAALVTSRSGLTGLVADPGARLVSIGMLPTADARELLRRRMGFDRVAAEPGAIDRLIAACAGLPLALAVVAGRAALMPQLPLVGLADELTDELTRLSVLHADEPGRDVESALAASVAVLDTATAQAFALLGLAPGPTMSCEAIAALCGMSAGAATSVVRSLGALHLLDQPYAGRFRMHDLVKLYAAQLGRVRPDAEQATGRLLRFYCAGARRPASAGQEFVAGEASALVAATELAANTGRDEAACELTACLEEYLGMIGCWRELTTLSELAVGSAGRLGDRDRQVAALIGLGRGLIGTGDFAAATPVLRRALAVAVELDDPAAQARAHRALARLAARQGRHDLALPHDRQGLDIHVRLGDRSGEANAYNAIGWHQAHLDHAGDALDSCSRALALFAELGDRAGQVLTLDSIGYALVRLARDGEAQLRYRQSADLAAALGWRTIRAETLDRLAQSYLCCGLTELGLQTRHQAQELLRSVGALAG